jgi:alkylation response protein AidB-like acyl-CoA dehydrogenase
MALNPIVDSRDVRFVLFEMLEVDAFTKLSRFSDFDKDMFEDTLTLAENIAVEQVYPANEEADKEGIRYDPDTKEVTVPACIKPGLAAYYEAGFIGLASDPEIGGMGMPEVIYQACVEYFTAASMTFSMYTSLSIGALNLIKNFGTDEQKSLYLEKMLGGEWGGTMCLTEPDAGSDVGALKSKAVKQDDGTYLITGQKIFISCGESDVYENMIHPVLARIEGDPDGTKGVSIFIVPKYRVNPDGSLGEFNDVVCSGIEHKMGIKSAPTCTLSFGDDGKCVGYLLGEQRKGMRIMFQMMNEARLYVGLQGLAISSTAYMHAVTYARNRVQGKHVTQMTNPDAPKVTINQHPDIKRTLLWMKSYVEGMRMLTYYLTANIDIAHASEGEVVNEANAMVEILIPICKAGNTDMSWLVTSEAIQVYGGYGYCSDYPVEQLARDSKILSLYEGTNGIQSMDLAMRKILMNPDQYNYGIMKKRMQETIERARGVVDDKYISPVERGVEKLDEVIEMMKGQMGEGKFMNIFMNATPLQQAMFMLALAWLHLWSLTITLPKMKELVGDAKGEEREKIIKDNIEAAFYTGKVLSSQYYIGAEFKKYFGKLDYILDDETAVLKASDEIFTGALEE